MVRFTVRSHVSGAHLPDHIFLQLPAEWQCAQNILNRHLLKLPHCYTASLHRKPASCQYLLCQGSVADTDSLKSATAAVDAQPP